MKIKRQINNKPDSPVKLNPEEARECAALYEKINAECKDLMPKALRLCELFHLVKEQHLYLYAKAGYDTFHEWAAMEHHTAKSTAYQYMNAGRVYKLLADSTTVDCKPLNERQLRPLLNVKDNKQVIDIWAEAIKLASVKPKSGKNVTENVVAKAKQTVVGKKAAPSAPGERLKKALATIWNYWPPEDHGEFFYAVWDQLRVYFEMVSVEHFRDEKEYRWFKKNLPVPDDVREPEPAAQEPEPETAPEPEEESKSAQAA